MNALSTGCLLAQFTKWERLGDGFRRTGPPLELVDFIPHLVGIVLVGGIVAAVITYRRRNDLSRPCTDSQKLFRELCLAHELDSGTQKLLGQLANAFQLAQPAEVFVSPQLFLPERLPEPLRAEAAQIAELRKRLF